MESAIDPTIEIASGSGSFQGANIGNGPVHRYSSVFVMGNNLSRWPENGWLQATTSN